MPVLKVRDPNTGQYVPLMSGGSGGPDEVSIATAEPSTKTDLWVDTDDPGGSTSDFVLKTGDTITGDLILESSHLRVMSPSINNYIKLGSSTVDNKGLSLYSGITGPNGSGGTARWILESLGSGHIGSTYQTDDLVLSRYGDTGAFLGTALSVARATGVVQIPGLAYQNTSTLSPASGWKDYGGNWGGMFVTKHAGMVTIEALLTRTSDMAAAAGTQYVVATLPVGFRPPAGHAVISQAAISVASPTGATRADRLDIQPDGSLKWYCGASATFSTLSFMSIVATFRQGG